MPSFDTLPLARQIAASLGDGWNAAPDPDDIRARGWSVVSHPCGEAFRLTTPAFPRAYPPRVIVTGLYSEGWTGSARITFSPARPADVLVRDVTHRFLPAYRRVRATFHAQSVAEAARQAAGQALAARWAVAFPTCRFDARFARVSLRISQGTSAASEVDISFRGDAVSVRFDALVPELAERLLSECAAYQAEFHTSAAPTDRADT
ncbi:hypothetical protein OG216_47510 (plasmid) [Streptomycetaceae bacterium NBC_01309]